MIPSSSPCTTSTGQRTARHTSSNASLVTPSRAATVSASTSGVVSRPQPVASSTGFVRCGSVIASPMKYSTNAR